MVRVLAPIILSLMLPACAITPPSSFFSSLSNNEEKPAQAAREQVRADPQAKKEAGLGSSIGGIWESVKSGLSFGGSSEPSVAQTGEVSGLDVNEALTLVNNYRLDKGLRPLRLNARLTDAALLHSKDLAKNDRISHYGSDGSDTWDRVRRTGYQASLTAENVGTGQLSLAEVFLGWQKSPDHNANLLLADAEEMGIALVHDQSTQFKTFWTMVIGSPVNAPQRLSRSE